MQKVESLSFPRWVSCIPRTNVTLHVFAYASERVYGCCVYVTEAGNNLLFSKAKVAPIKLLSLPRLELQAA